MSHENENTTWMQTLWRPMMGWMYMIICMLDMAVFPVLWALWQGIQHVPITQWNPLTLQGAGLFHIAMGAVLGISAFGRTQEKLAGTAANPTATSQTITNNANMSGNVAGGYGSNQSGMNNGMNGGMGMSSNQMGSFGGNTGGMTGSFGGSTGSSFGSTTMAPTITPPPVTPPTSSKSVVPTSGFPPL